ncbi:MAG TPA: PaaI family thioesterase [Solirubrobacteraceae bacterium]|nr:PaaI family thioesterase [Solirubrobacteraceae bacterium]
MQPAEPHPDASLAGLLAAVPFVATLGIEVVSASPEEVVGRLAWREELCTAGGALNGGALMSLADNMGGTCAFLNLPPGAGTATISSSTNFLRGVREGYVTATSRPLRVGKSVIVVETELRDHDGRLAAQTTQAQAVIGPSATGALPSSRSF